MGLLLIFITSIMRPFVTKSSISIKNKVVTYFSMTTVDFKEPRLFAFNDVLINYSGYITGALIVLIIYYFIDKKRVAQKSDSDKLD